MNYLKEFLKAFVIMRHIITSFVVLSFAVATTIILINKFDPRYVLIISLAMMAQTLFIIIVLFIPNHKHLFTQENTENGTDEGEKTIKHGDTEIIKCFAERKD